ncbi:hypothetical protein GUJ93_ZPchr0011g28768 [Zizania palustris]|uniref:Uncharacterized protein n=1 Tax=Zizania palustris TaxID=103762 RepID=A0A8J5WHF0_ZIZPA|nr:hypothetical protein GUJ93_ZPchr0011g28768 [Zizania palustris]
MRWQLLPWRWWMKAAEDGEHAASRHLHIEREDVGTESPSAGHWLQGGLPVEEAVHVDGPSGDDHHVAVAKEVAPAPAQEPASEDEEESGSDDEEMGGGIGRTRVTRQPVRARRRRRPERRRRGSGLLVVPAVILLAVVALVASWKHKPPRRPRALDL